MSSVGNKTGGKGQPPVGSARYRWRVEVRGQTLKRDMKTDHVNVAAIQGERGARVDGGGGEDGLVELGLGAFDDVAAVATEDVVEL